MVLLTACPACARYSIHSSYLILLSPFYRGGSQEGEVLAQVHVGCKWGSGVGKAGLDYSEPRGLSSTSALADY